MHFQSDAHVVMLCFMMNLKLRLCNFHMKDLKNVVVLLNNDDTDGLLMLLLLINLPPTLVFPLVCMTPYICSHLPNKKEKANHSLIIMALNDQSKTKSLLIVHGVGPSGTVFKK